MRRMRLILLFVLSVAVFKLLICYTKPEVRVAKDLQDKHIIYRSDDLKIIAMSSDLRENAFLFEIKSAYLNFQKSDKVPLSIRGVDQSNSTHGLDFLNVVLELWLNIHFDKKEWSVWEVVSNSDQIFLIQQCGKFYILICYI